MKTTATRMPVFLLPGQGRAYPMGRISALFKADGAETANLYAVSEWWLEPHRQGPGPHSHPEDNVFGFEPQMPETDQWFVENPPGPVGTPER